MKERIYAAIDLKSFYASVECILRGLDPLTTNLVVADRSRTDKTICLAVSPSLKSFGIPGRPRLFEVVQKVEEINTLRKEKAPGRKFRATSSDAPSLERDPSLELDYIVAPPQMAHYMQCSAAIYQVYLKHVAPEDIHVYSIDEVFMEITPYLNATGLSADAFVRRILQDVVAVSGVTATAGLGTNLFLCKVAMDIVAKHIPADREGVRIVQLDGQSYRKLLWGHRPLTDFWRVGRGYARKLEQHGMFTMGDIARFSATQTGQELLYKLFGINAELLIDHAWGWEPCTIEQIKAYRPSTNSLSSGQVLHTPYSFEKAGLIVREMTDLLVLDLVEKGLETDQLTLTIGYDIENLTNPEISRLYTGPITIDHYGRRIPKHAHGTVNLPRYCASTSLITGAMMELFERIVDPALLVRRITLTANRLQREGIRSSMPEQMDLFTDYKALEAEKEATEKEKRRQKAVLAIKRKYGKNAILKGMNLQEGATAKDRNSQIGGHRAGDPMDE